MDGPRARGCTTSRCGLAAVDCGALKARVGMNQLSLTRYQALTVSFKTVMTIWQLPKLSTTHPDNNQIPTPKRKTPVCSRSCARPHSGPHLTWFHIAVGPPAMEMDAPHTPFSTRLSFHSLQQAFPTGAPVVSKAAKLVPIAWYPSHAGRH